MCQKAVKIYKTFVKICQKFVKKLSKFVKHFSKFFKICQKFIKICQMLLEFFKKFEIFNRCVTHVTYVVLEVSKRPRNNLICNWHIFVCFLNLYKNFKK